MSTRDPTPMLQAATAAYKDSRQIAIIGPPRCGKTVVAGLLYDSIVNKFLPEYSSYRLQVENGLDFLQKTMLTLKGGEFPAKTPASEINKVDIVLRQDVATGGSIAIKLHDVVGETYQDLYIQEVPTNERLFRTLDPGKASKTKQYADTSFLLFCKLYIILVDCAEFKNWNKISYDNVKLVNTILQWKEGIKESANGKIKTPIAVMFTKTDLLEEKMRGKTGEELLKENMPEFYQQLKSTVDRSLAFFKMHIEVDSTPANERDPSQPINFKVRTPIKYSIDEYAKLILWIDQSMKD